MPHFERASEFEIKGGQFTDIEINGSVFVGPRTDNDQAVRRLVENDASLNQYSADHGTLNIPHFSKALLLRDLHECPDMGRISSGSCAFDLLIRLGLFPGQPNDALAEYDTAVPVGSVVSRGNCYCGKISRHGFIFLVSKYFQHASLAEVAGGGICIVISTTIGRFKCYEIGDRTIIHFDIGTRSSHVELITGQNLDDIFRAAQGQYLTEEPNSLRPSKWIRESARSLEYLATECFFSFPNAVIYMTKDTRERWTKLKTFAHALIETVLCMADELTEPASFTTAMHSVYHDIRRLVNTPNPTPPEKLALCLTLCRIMPRDDILQVAYKDFLSYSATNMSGLTTAHQHYRSQKVEAKKLLATSQDRFLLILHQYHSSAASPAFSGSHPSIRNELKNLLQPNKANNVTLLVYQGFLGTTALWNSVRVLSRAREAPEEWIGFVNADEDDVFIG